jgi:hypothetical protein
MTLKSIIAPAILVFSLAAGGLVVAMRGTPKPMLKGFILPTVATMKDQP